MIGLDILDMWSVYVLIFGLLGSKIAIVLYVPGKWSVLFVSCAGGGI